MKANTTAESAAIAAAPGTGAPEYWAAAFAAVAVLALFAVNLFCGDVNQDEGWYLYAARLVNRGELPYVDFACTQGPVMPFVYALATPLVTRWGVAGGRAFTVLFGLLATCGAALLAARLAPRRWRWPAGVVALALAGINVYQTYFCAVVKTYALTALLLTGGVLLLAVSRGRRGRAAAFAAAVSLVLAAGTRLSAAFVMPPALVWLAVRAVHRERSAPGIPDRRWLWFAAGAAVAALAVFLPFAVTAPRGLWFALVEYHTGRQTGGVGTALAYKAGFLSRCAAAYGVAAAALAAGLVGRWVLGHAASAGREGASAVEAEGAAEPGLAAAVWAGVLLVTGVHVAAPFPYDDYQVIVYPLFVAALSAWLAQLAGAGIAAGSVARVRWLMYTVLAACLLAAGSAPLAWQWALGERDRIWWPLRTERPVAQLRRVGQLIRKEAGAGAVLLTQDTYLAVEANLDVPRGFELGPFCYFPDWPAEKARACRVVNRDMLTRILTESGAGVAAFSGYGLAIACPGVVPLSVDERARLLGLVRREFAETRVEEKFGQAATRLEIYRRRGERL